MAKKVQTVYVCTECGYESPKWMGQCICGAWNTMAEEKILPQAGEDKRRRTGSGRSAGASSSSFSPVGKGGKPLPLSSVKSGEKDRIDTGIEELNRVLGGGLVKGSLTLISGEPVKGERFIKRASGGILADGMNSMLAGIFNSFPNSVFAQNNGIIQLTGVASRYVGYYIAGMLMILGLFPAIGLVFSLIPEPVLGGATLLMFGTVAAAGIQIIASQRIGRKEVLVIALSLSFGLSVELVPEVLDKMSITVRNIFSSGITTGGLTAILSNLLIRIKET